MTSSTRSSTLGDMGLGTVVTHMESSKYHPYWRKQKLSSVQRGWCLEEILSYCLLCICKGTFQDPTFWGDKVSTGMFTHTYPHKLQRKINGAICNHQADWTFYFVVWHLMWRFASIEKRVVKHDTEYHCWDQVSLYNTNLKLLGIQNWFKARKRQESVTKS